MRPPFLSILHRNCPLVAGRCCLGTDFRARGPVDGGSGILTEEDRETLLTGGIRLAPYGMEKLALELTPPGLAVAKTREVGHGKDSRAILLGSRAVLRA